MFGNCYIIAWKKYLSGEAVWLCFRQSRYSKLIGKIPMPIRWTAKMLLYPVAALYAILHTLALETWPHFVWSRWPPDGGEEFVPYGSKSQRYIPPVLFDGYIKEIHNRPESGVAHTNFDLDLEQ